MPDAALEDLDLTVCDLEPIHIPGSIQPHGIMLVVNRDTLEVVGGAGDIEGRLARDWLGRSASELLGFDFQSHVARIAAEDLHFVGPVHGADGFLNAVAYRSGDFILLEMDEADTEVRPTAALLHELDAAAIQFEKAPNMEDLCRRAATVFQSLTGYSRVMVYQFLDDAAGVVVGEALGEGTASFMNHHFPASDIPRQARALYIRNRVRVIPDVHYKPQPIRPAAHGLATLDLSDSTLRSVSPIHIQYLKNMEVAASASISIVKDGVLWGLVACHHHELRELSLTVRMSCRALGSALARQIRAREDAELYRERLRLRGHEETILARLGADRSLGQFFSKSGPELARLLAADGFAAVQGGDLYLHGNCPDPVGIRDLAEWVRRPASIKPVAYSSLGEEFEPAKAYAAQASGLLAVTMSTEVPTILLWFRAEHLEVVNWAGNPHKNSQADPNAVLTPRASFDAWSESVRGRARRWSLAEVESATRIVRLMLEARNNARIKELNQDLTTSLKENESLLTQKDYLLKEVNHRVQNSLSLVSAFLKLQSRSSDDPAVRLNLEEAQRRIMAVSLVHRRLYQDNNTTIVDLARYLEELCQEIQTAMDEGWSANFHLDLAPILISTDRAINVGLVLTELVINASKYAYGGSSGPLSVSLEQHRGSFRLIVADHGKGKRIGVEAGGFGSKIVNSIVSRLHGYIEESDNQPGLRTILTAPVEEESPR